MKIREFPKRRTREKLFLRDEEAMIFYGGIKMQGEEDELASKEIKSGKKRAQNQTEQKEKDRARDLQIS